MLEGVLASAPNWIQAVGALCMVGLTLITLIVLNKYAADTKRIAQASVSQIENSHMPFLAVVMRDSATHSSGGWGIENQGFGPAMNALFIAPPVKRSIHTVAQGTIIPVHYDIEDAFRAKQPVVFEYESLSGSRYRTTVTFSKDATQTQFEKLTRDAED